MSKGGPILGLHFGKKNMLADWKKKCIVLPDFRMFYVLEMSDLILSDLRPF